MAAENRRQLAEDVTDGSRPTPSVVDPTPDRRREEWSRWPMGFARRHVERDVGFGGTTVGMNCGCRGYGGGGGLYGGAASGNCRGGGGGSGYAASVPGITNAVHTTGGARPGNGRIEIAVH